MSKHLWEFYAAFAELSRILTTASISSSTLLVVERIVADIIYLATGVAFVALILGLVAACAALEKRS